MAATFVFGSYLGSKPPLPLIPKLVKQIFGAAIVLIGIKMLWNK